MNYALKVAEDGKISIDVSKSGNKYTVSVWDKAEHKSRGSRYFTTYEKAHESFLAEARKHGVAENIKDVDHDPNDFNFD